MKILQIDVTVNYGSTGKIAEDIGLSILESNNESIVAFGRYHRPSASTIFKFGNKFDQAIHLLITRLFDRQGYGSYFATKKLIQYIRKINPDIIHLHVLHGYYLNIELLFNFLKDYNKPVVWTFHDCWQITGHCCHFSRVSCNKWETECNNCPLTKYYPNSWGFDNSKNNFYLKKKLFTSLDNMHIVTVSNWLEAVTRKSFLRNKNIQTIHNGIDTDLFKKIDGVPIKVKHHITDKKVILGVASVWSDLKGLEVFKQIAGKLNDDIVIILIGLNKEQIKNLPSNIIGIERTENQHELTKYYSMADVFVNPSLAESFGLVTVEAQACGTPVVVFDNTASPELVKNNTGFVIPNGDVNKMYEAIINIIGQDKSVFSEACRNNVVENYNKTKQLKKYIDLYESVLQTNQ